MDVKYPIGRAKLPEGITSDDIERWTSEVEDAPAQLRAAVNGLSAGQLDTPYRPLGWTVRQVIHHLADTHVNTYLNFKHALTEETPVMPATDINRWANLSDSVQGDMNLSLDLFASIQMRWALLLKTMSLSDFEKTMLHPSGEHRPLWRLLGTYAWHSQHHTAHITELRKSRGWV
ncbi:YfiT family bacillithiol transferase [Alicyclobacillus sp. SO9]|uniref:YfiT family bacillithiol transferase n=1 Tax=Alicyclobacillus sp. SO9 TaxID=2665646 RepID=UPI0018E759CB|nr:putative metal-dependent hydrolase [Alicyclobacillus sp. SO9]QQE76844.1 putative metal-dependent hydrolase [Alicyclobacillus sp. SO9]